MSLQQATFFRSAVQDVEAEAPLWMGRLPVLQRWGANVCGLPGVGTFQRQPWNRVDGGTTGNPAQF